MLKNFCCIEYREGSKEEILPDFMPDFPYISSYMEFDIQKAGRFVPWHWHKAVSYTHLDVYKRQGIKNPAPRASHGNPEKETV